jgi:hypothetical protein
MLAHPLENKLVWCQQAQRFGCFLGVQWADPGVELLFGQLVFETYQTFLPQLRFHPSSPLLFLLPKDQGGAVYTPRKKLSTPRLLVVTDIRS